MTNIQSFKVEVISFSPTNHQVLEHNLGGVWKAVKLEKSSRVNMNNTAKHIGILVKEESRREKAIGRSANFCRK